MTGLSEKELMLLQVAQMIADREKQKLAIEQNRRNALESQIGQIRSMREAALGDMPFNAQATAKSWGQWSDAELSRLNLSLAQTTVRQQSATNRARRAVGRCIALEMVLEELSSTDAQDP